MSKLIDINKVAGRTAGDLNEKLKFRSAVCIPLIKKEDGSFEILFEVRSSKVGEQPKDICLPGGKIEGNETPFCGAVRELCEELRIKKEQFEFLGPIDVLHSESLVIYPFAGILTGYENTFDPFEVGKVFTVPLDFFVGNEPEVYKMKLVPEPCEDFPYDKIEGGKNYKWRDRVIEQYFYQYGEYCIWGLTARIIKSFVDLIKE